MENPRNIAVTHWVQYLAIRGALAGLSVLPLRWRGRLISAIAGIIVPLAAGSRRRMLRNFDLIYPNMPKQKKQKLMRDVAGNAAVSLTELLMNRSYSKRHDLFNASGPGLKVLEDQAQQGKGAIIVSAHFGQWEAIRHVMKSRGMETGAIYRENSNPLYERFFLENIKYGGSPIVKRGASGNRAMVKHLKGGGFFALLVDQKVHADAWLPFIGHKAQTTTSPAAMAIKYNLPIIPAFALRKADGVSIEIEFEQAIEVSDSLTMTQEINDRISARILDNPSQWYWLHKRWEAPDFIY